MGKMISPSMMCVDICNIKYYLDKFTSEHIPYLHIDVMDGSFVPNYQLGTDYIKQLRRVSTIPLDIHLMIKEPEYKLEWFDIHENEFVSVHYESTPNIHRAVSYIKKLGAKPMVALNPGTPVTAVEYLLPDISGILLMTVNPGFAGQTMITQMLNKIEDTKRLLLRKNLDNVVIEVDGNVSFENARKMKQAGADMFVAGTASIFNSKLEIGDAIEKFRQAIS